MGKYLSIHYKYVEKYQKLNINIRLLTYATNLKRPKNDKALKEKWKIKTENDLKCKLFGMVTQNCIKYYQFQKSYS